MSRKLLKHMTKAQIKASKAQSKKRHNRRLQDGEAARVMAQAGDVLGINENKPSYGIEDRTLLDAADAMITLRDGYDKKNHRNPKKLTPKMKQALEILNSKGVDCSRFRPENKKIKMYNRLTNRQFKALMKEASEKLGINDNETIPIMDVNKHRHYDIPKLIDLILTTLDYSEKAREQHVRREYEKTIKNKKIRKNRDKLAVLAYLVRRTYNATKDRSGVYPLAPPKTPMCLLDKKQKNNEVRKIVKFHGDKNRIVRIIPDEEFLKEVINKKRVRLDAFDRMTDDKKIAWARQANLILGTHDFAYLFKRNFEGLRNIGFNNIEFAMRYACKMCNIPEFKGIFAAPYWIAHRIGKYSERITSKEFNVFFEMALEHLGVNEVKTIPVLNEQQVVEKMLPTLKKMKLYKKYQRAIDGRRNPLDVIKNLVLNNG